LWEKYLEPEYRVPGKLALWREEGKFGSYLKINGEMFRDNDNVNIPSYGVWRPGMTWESVGELDPNVRYSGSRYFCQISGGSTTWESPSKTAKLLLDAAMK